MTPTKYYRIVLLSFGMLVFLSCGENKSDDAENAFQKGNYKLAIQLYSEALKGEPENRFYKERVALSYMNRGFEFYATTGNVKSFSGNIEKALEFIPEESSPEFKEIYSNMLLKLAEAYIKSTPQNEIERESFLNQAITYLDEALFQYTGNRAADSLLEKIKSDNFQKMLDKGKNFYSEATRTGKDELFFSAEYYLKKASEFDMHNDEVKKLLAQTREKSLPLINVNDDIALAVADHTYQDNRLILDLRIQNFLTTPLQVDIGKFELIDKDGNVYHPVTEAMSDKLKEKSIKSVTLDQKKTFTDGLIIFPVSERIKLDYLTYSTDKMRVTKKYFP